MFIIGKTRTGFLIEACGEEIANIVGVSYYKREKDLEVGDEINVSQIYERLESLRTHEAEIATYIKDVKEELDTIKKKMPLILKIGNKKE